MDPQAREATAGAATRPPRARPGRIPDPPPGRSLVLGLLLSLAAAGLLLASSKARIASLRRLRDVVRVLIAGSLPDELHTTARFRVPLTDQAAVERTRTELEQEVIGLRRTLKLLTRGAKDAGADDGGVQETPEARARAVC